MTQLEIENTLIKAICNLEISYLVDLDEDLMYTCLTKAELIQEFDCVFKNLISQGIQKLTFKKSNCNYCYPKANAYEFYDESLMFVFRYIIDIDSECNFIIRLCDNKPESNNSELPF
ncbi:hypothetical protein SAMN04489797_1710 [Winogradskyella sediminis]|uniref:Uncharacterized protein n=1 Tax=Winogradskyella sediminis TaxID=1382466 RepID=A0A1H1SLW3_9FLAO|nr:hypothetical protein SAMN04489797_1710 [Winogradskyella sediminis]